LYEDVDALDDVLLECGDEKYIHARLSYEEHLASGGPENTPVTTKLTYKDLVPPDVKWSDLFESLTEARKWLAVVAAGRTRADSHRRARTRVRATYLLQYLAPILAILVGGLAWATVLLIEPSESRAWEVVLLAGTAGAVGSSLAALYQVRDQLLRIDELREFWPAMLVQPLLGAAAGLVLLLILESGLLGLVQPDATIPWPSTGVLAFAAGFSEAWFLSLVERLADLAEARGTGGGDARRDNADGPEGRT
jgi:hypothetical protein